MEGADVVPVADSAAAAPATSGAKSYSAVRNALRQGGQAARDGAQQAGQYAQAEAKVVGAQAKEVAIQQAANTKQAYQDASAELGDPALKQAARQSLEATKARAAVLHQQGQVAAQEMQGIAQEAAQRGMEKGMAVAEQTGQMAIAAADVARQQFESRWNDVQNMERQLAIEAGRLEKFERQLLSLTRNDVPNFPPINCCCIEPMVFHSIVSDISAERQPFVKGAYFLYFFTCFLLLYNFGIALAVMLMKTQDSYTGLGIEERGPHLGISTIMLFGIVLAFVLWYWPTYKACGTGSSGQHLMSYIGLVVAIIFNIIVVVGPMGFGGCGFLYGMEVRDAYGDGIMYACLANAVAFGIETACFMFMFYRMKCVYGSEDKASIVAANRELAGDSILSGVFRA